MKRIVNILSCLWLLLLMLVVACSDLEEIVINMQGEEEVELTIQTNVPALGGGTTRTAPTENITSITALAFAKDDDDYKLIKVVTEGVVKSTNDATSGTYTVTVPLRTRRIHFIAKNADVFDTFSTKTDYGKGEDELLKDLTTTELHYWGKLDFNDATALKAGGDVTLIRNMAKLELTLPTGVIGYIAGFLNYNTDGTIAAYSEKDTDFLYSTDKTSTHYLPATHTNNDEEDKYKDAQTKPQMEYLFEEENSNGDYVYVICNIDSKYYKIAFAYADANGDPVYFPIVRNHSYTINIKEGYDTTYGVGSFEEAIDAAPINATAQEEVEFIFDYETIIMFIEDRTCEISVTIPEGITQLKVLPVNIFTIQSISPELTLGDNGLYTVTSGTKYTFTLELDESHTETGKAPVRFIGNGVGKVAHKDVEVKLRRKATIAISPEERTINNTQGSNCYFDVTIPANIDNFVIEAGEAFAVTSVATLNTTPVEPNDDGSYAVTNATYRVTLTLKDDAVGQIGDNPIHFVGTSEYWGAEGTATITLQEYVAQDLGVYEMWFENNTWNGSQDYDVFFTHEGEMTTTSEYATNLRTEFYDDGANAHISQAMVMGSDDSFTFTIPEGSSRWLTMLVASDGSGNTPSIQLSNGTWATASSSDAVVPATYNFGNGEIGTAGRLIRYELPAGTYTLKGSDAADYLLYYMRVSTTKPTMTDIAQPTADDYSLSWSGGQYAKTKGKGYLKISDSKHIVDEDNLTHTVALKDENSLKTSINLSTSTLSGIDLDVETTRVTFTNENENTYSSSKTTQNFNNVADSYQLTTYNAGAYTLSGTIDNPTYKYSAFYDKLQLKSVEYEVKNPIKPGLYNSMNGNVLTPVDGFTNLDEAWAIGFLMPSVVPDLVVSPEHYKIDINIPDWTMSTEISSGLGVIGGENGNYTLGTQTDSNDNEMIHPREGWTYKIAMASIADDEIVPSLAGEEASDTDHYFTYKGTIDKQVSIPTPYTETALDIALDFYADVNANSTIENRDNNVYEDLLLGTSRFYLKATISLEDATKYNNAIVNLTGSYETNSIHWVNSRVSSNNNNNITYIEDNGTGLKFTITAGVTEYLIEWVFVTGSYYGGGDIGFTYNISNGQGYTLTGDTSAQIAFTNESQILVATNGSTASNSIELSLEYGDNSVEEFTVDVPVPTNVSGINIAASDFAVSIGKVATGDQEYPDAAVEVNGNYTFTDSDAPRFKFKLNGTPANNQSVITFTSADGNATPATVTVNWTPRGAETNQTTIWSGAMDLQWTQNYLETTTKQLAAGTQVTLNFTTINDQNGQIKLHDSSGTSISGDNGFTIANGETQYSFTLQTAVSGLKINGNNVRMTSIVVSTATASTENVVIDLSNGIGTVTNNGGNGSTVTVENGSLVLNNPSSTTNDYDVQLYVEQNYEAGSYTLTYKVRGSTAGYTQQAFQVQDGYVNASEFFNFDFTTEWSDFEHTFTVTQDCDRFLINFGKFQGTIYIDDLKLVKND